MSTKVSVIHNIGVGSISLTIIGKVNSSIYLAPTDNCQIWSIGSFNHLASSVVTKEERKVFLEEAHRLVGKKQLLLVDVPANTVENVKAVFGTRIRNNYPYTSTNGSLMHILLIDTRSGWIEDIK